MRKVLDVQWLLRDRGDGVQGELFSKEETVRHYFDIDVENCTVTSDLFKMFNSFRMWVIFGHQG